ncbi:ras and ef-hand domain-containing protein [Anaeramoeba flamelloides]|uniref:Ras and ef-hand domain-containing protein n=1 Tax=Anaeramoeba flamelloides TaxID=1746091 RepID=A0ABQ8Y1V3_9EUKA|nr:ras and ef-hand domain-containing protein [Anaeramoeba flamelloides]
MSDEFSLKFKVVLLGQSAVGKTSICIRFCQNEFSLNQEPTIGAAFQNCVIDLGDNQVTLQIWDTAGQERYNSLTSMYYRGAKGAIIVYDVTNYDTYEGAKDWIKEIREQGSSSLKIMLVGNKTDLKNHSVDRTKVLEYCKKHNLLFSEVSAKYGIGIEDLFYDLAAQMMNNYKVEVLGENSLNFKKESQENSQNIIIKEDFKKDKTDSNCC